MKKKVESKNTFKNQETKTNEELIQYEELEQYDFYDEDYIDEMADEYGKLIGLFLINFSQLEHRINQAIADFMFDDAHESGYVIIGYLTMVNKIEFYFKHHIRLVEFMDEIYKKRITKLDKDLESINEFRNSIVHANWATLNKEGFVRTKIKVDNNDGLVKFKKVKMTNTIIEEKIQEIDRLIDEVYEVQEFLNNHGF